jgi:cellulose biosynthesis protein BcsQ
MNISKEKLEIAKKLNKNADIFRVLEEEIKEAVFKKLKASVILAFLEKETGKKLSLNALQKFIATNKKRWIEENKENKIKGKKMSKNYILFTNDKGGVGKTTLATLVDLPNSVILNLDKTRVISDIYPYKKIIDFGRVEKEENITLDEFLEVLNENEEIENIIIDTKGGISDELVKVLPYVNSIIIPLKVGDTSEKPTYEYITNLKEYLDILNQDNVKWGIVYNEISPKYLKRVDFGKYELIDEFNELGQTIKEGLLGDDLVTLTYFKRSEAITTRERTKKDIDELMKTNIGAYLAIQKEVKRFNNEIKKTLKD